MWSAIASIVGSLLNNSNDSKNTNTVELTLKKQLCLQMAIKLIIQ